MKKLVFLLLHFIFIHPVIGQQVNGIIMYQNSGEQPAEGVEISSFGCSTTYSQDNGMFILTCNNKRPGQKLRLIVGKTDGSGKSIEVVNSSHLKLLRIPDSPDHDPVEIVVCKAGQRDQAASRYYNILASTNNRVYERKLSNIEKLLEQKNLDADAITQLLKEKDELTSERDEAEEKLEEQAVFIASINQDRASDMVRTAIQKIEQEQDVEAALEVLDNNKLEESYQIATDKKLKAEAEIKQVIEGYKLKVSMLLPKFEYNEVSACYDRILEIHESNNFDKEELANLIFSAAEVLNNNGKYDKALEYQQKAVDIKKELLDAKDPDLASALTKIGLTYYLLGQYEKALENQETAINIKEEVLGADDPELGVSYNEIGLTYLKTGQHDKALDYLQKSIALRVQILDPNSPELADSYNNIALTYNYMGQDDKALEYLHKALDIELQIHDPKHPDIATLHHNIGLCYKSLREFDKALENEEKALSIREEVLNPNHPELAASYGGLSGLYISRKEYDKALEYQEKAIKIRQEILNPKHADLATSYNNLAIIYRNLKEYDLASEYYHKSIEIKEEIFDPMHPKLALAYNNVGVFYRSIGQHEKAIEYQQKAIDIKEAKLNPMHPDLALSYNSIGITYYQIKQYKKALEFQNKAVEIREEVYGPDNPRIATTYRYYALTLCKSKKFDEAHAIMLKLEALVPDDNRLYRNWAVYYALKKDKEKAISSLQTAITMGFSDLAWLENDDSMDNIREEQGFINLLNSLKKEPK